MKKLKLQLDDLAIESFATARGASARGTAHAHGDLLDPMADVAGVEDTGDGVCFTCELSCGGRGCE